MTGSESFVMSTSALRCREVMALTIIFIMACKFTIFPFINRMDEMYSSNNGDNNNDNSNHMLTIAQNNNNNNMVNTPSQEDMLSVKKVEEYYAKEIFRLQAEHNLKVATMMQQHSNELNDLKSQLVISKSETAHCRHELQQSATNLALERKRLDHILIQNVKINKPTKQVVDNEEEEL
jgi:hypothetical protein